MSHPPSLDFFDVLGTEYCVDWRLMTRGASFFIPTTATPGQVSKSLREVRKALDIDLVVKPRREFGIYGMRIWRTR
jgi:hypothetical protein